MRNNNNKRNTEDSLLIIFYLHFKIKTMIRKNL
jgi:hypothetical protein